MSPVETLRRPVGRLPARVYWVRRLLVLGTIFALVFAVARLVTDDTGGPSPGDVAEVTAGRATASQTAKTPSHLATDDGTMTALELVPTRFGPVPVDPAGTGQKNGDRKKGDYAATVSGSTLVSSSGPCTYDEITVEPRVGAAIAGSPVRFTLALTGIRPACDLAISPKSLAVRVRSGADRIWTTQQCPAAVPKTSVTVRNSEPVEVELTWPGRRSDDACDRNADWAFPGYYHVAAAIVGSDPTETRFRLEGPTRKVITKVLPDPEAKKAAKRAARKAARQKAKQAARDEARAVEAEQQAKAAHQEKKTTEKQPKKTTKKSAGQQ